MGANKYSRMGGTEWVERQNRRQKKHKLADSPCLWFRKRLNFEVSQKDLTRCQNRALPIRHNILVRQQIKMVIQYKMIIL